MESCAKPGRDGRRLRNGLIMMTIAMTMLIHHTSSAADLSTLIQMTVQSLRERPERAALEPPTVTSLKPPSRKTNTSRRLGGISVQGEQSGSHIPPVVASRSPSSSSSSRDYKNRYVHVNVHAYHPLAPVATASSGYRPGSAGILTGRRSLSDTHREVPAPTSHLINETVSMQQESSWVPPVPYGPPPSPPRNGYGSPGYAPIGRSSYPRHRSRMHEDTRVLDPSYVDVRPQDGHLYNSGGGVWGSTRGRPIYSQTHPRDYDGHSVMEESPRTDTFGLRISEDLSHLSGQHPLRRGSSRGSPVHQPIDRADTYNPSRGSHMEEDIHIINQNQYHPQKGTSHLNAETDDVDEQGETPFSLSKSKDTNSSIRKFGIAPTTYGSSFSTDRRHMSKSHPEDSITRHEFHKHHHHSSHEHQQNATLSVPHPDPVPSTSEETRRPLTLHEIWHMKNMSTWDEFVEFLQRKGIRVGQVLSKINDGATREEMTNFLDKPDLKPQPSHDLDDRLIDGDTPKIQHSTESLSLHPSIPVGAPEEHGTVVSRHSISKSREGKKKKRGKGKKRERKNRENRKRRRRKNKKQAIPDITVTTVIPSSDIGSINESLSHIHQEPTTTVPPITSLTSTLASSSLPSLTSTELYTETEMSTRQPMQSQLPTQFTFIEHATTEPPNIFTSQIQDTVLETSPQQPFNKTAVLEQPDLPLSVTPPVILTRTTTVKPVLLVTFTTQQTTSMTPEGVSIPAMLTTEFTSTSTTPLPKSTIPRAGSLTLPPSSKPSKVSIISLTVMKVPKHNNEGETRIEDVTATRRKQNHRTLRKKKHKFHPQRMSTQPRLLSSVSPRTNDNGMVIRTPFVRDDRKDHYTFPVRGFMIITGIMGALAVFTLVVLISYAIIKCSKQPVVNNYQVSEQKPPTE